MTFLGATCRHGKHDGEACYSCDKPSPFTEHCKTWAIACGLKGRHGTAIQNSQI